jgi:cyclopropane-fatty-acyl-phospholipid synthase
MATIATSSPVLRSARGSSALRGGIEELLAKADIRVNGRRPWDMRIHSPGVFDRIASRGSLGLGEAYMDGDWDADALDEFFNRVLQARLDREVRPLRLWLPALRARLFNLQDTRRAWQVGRAHYDLGNDFYQAMLGPTMVYSCGYWKNASTLDEAQEAKLDLVCRKLQLQPGMRVLDIGCGWGSFMAHAADRHGVECAGVTVSKEQAEFSWRNHVGLPLHVSLQDYRDIEGTYDRIASIGMFEHVGRKNHRAFMKTVRRCLADDGIFLLHTIGKNARADPPDPWIEKHIFPNGEVPSIGQIAAAIDGLFVVEDLHNFGADYDPTLMAWHANFEAAWPRFAEALGERFHRQWRYYLLACAGAFRARDLQVWQWVLTPRGIPGGLPRVG